jgi:hypothetical protein
MKVEIKEKKVKALLKYPYIGIELESKNIVLFSEPNKGVCLDSGDTKNTMAEYAANWAEDMFTPFNGTITLSND